MSDKSRGQIDPFNLQERPAHQDRKPVHCDFYSSSFNTYNNMWTPRRHRTSL